MVQLTGRIGSCQERFGSLTDCQKKEKFYLSLYDTKILIEQILGVGADQFAEQLLLALIAASGRSVDLPVQRQIEIGWRQDRANRGRDPHVQQQPYD